MDTWSRRELARRLEWADTTGSSDIILVYLAWSSREQVGARGSRRERAQYFTYEDPPKEMFLSKFPLDRSFKGWIHSDTK